mgnify:CR=1 FL=1
MIHVGYVRSWVGFFHIYIYKYAKQNAEVLCVINYLYGIIMVTNSSYRSHDGKTLNKFSLAVHRGPSSVWLALLNPKKDTIYSKVN